ncbi:MAG: hypothetical protein NTW17_00145 [Candidatus Pacearchaeota archaeon]|nr:hypothetical protein [Candidatus Pacearchaeota archaeon]
MSGIKGINYEGIRGFVNYVINNGILSAVANGLSVLEEKLGFAPEDTVEEHSIKKKGEYWGRL